MSNIEHLLVERYEVIADWPNSVFDVGSILSVPKYNYDKHIVRTEDDRYGIDISTCDKYPHLFRRLHWSEKRELSEMPVFLKNTNTSRIYKILMWSIENSGIAFTPVDHIFMFRVQGHHLPATETEYNNYINKP